MRELTQFNGMKMPIAVLLAASAICLAGCFVFDNPYDTNSPLPTATFQIVVNSSGSGWSGAIPSIDDGAGGISRPGCPDLPVGNGQTLQVTFTSSDPGNSATY